MVVITARPRRLQPPYLPTNTSIKGIMAIDGRDHLYGWPDYHVVYTDDFCFDFINWTLHPFFVVFTAWGFLDHLLTIVSVANNGQRQRPTAVTKALNWRDGDVAFLKWSDQFNEEEKRGLLDSGQLHPRSTGHPVIILYRSGDAKHYIVTTVSAYSSGEMNGFLPPWEQAAHGRKFKDDFRAFEGSARPNNKFKCLRLKDSQQWPKPRTSWVFVKRPYLVPASALIIYTKARSRLSMTPESLEDLRQHMGHRSGIRQLKMELDKKSLGRSHQKPDKNKSSVENDRLKQPWRRCG